MKLTCHEIKELARDLGSDLCGIAPVERFADAPEGFRPIDIYAETRSAVVIGKTLPEAAFVSPNPVPYTFACNTILDDVSRITCEMSIRLQEMQVTAVPMPSEPYMHWDEQEHHGQGILSLRHAAWLAGLGTLGRNTLLINKALGNRITLGALLLNIELKGDPISDYKPCRDNCQACIQTCPAKALDGETVTQKLCRQESQLVTKKGYALYACNKCRLVCPSGRGSRYRDL